MFRRGNVSAHQITHSLGFSHHSCVSYPMLDFVEIISTIISYFSIVIVMIVVVISVFYPLIVLGDH